MLLILILVIYGRVTIWASKTWDPTMKPNKASYISKCPLKSQVYQTAGHFCINLWRFKKSKMASKMAAVLKKNQCNGNILVTEIVLMCFFDIFLHNL